MSCAGKRKRKEYAVTNFKDYTFEDLANCFELTIVEAANELGVSETYLKRLCRAFNLSRWPYRRIEALKNKKDMLQTRITENPGDQSLIIKISEVEEEMTYIKKYGLKEDGPKRPTQTKVVLSNGIKKKRGRPAKMIKPEAVEVKAIETSKEPKIDQDLEPLLQVKEELVLPVENYYMDDQENFAPLGFKLKLDIVDLQQLMLLSMYF
jgi:AraC-like DNA-binding protein